MNSQHGTATKQADGPITIKHLAGALLGSALAGFGIRGTVGLSKLLGRRMQSEATPAPEPVSTPKPKEEEEFELKLASEFEKVAIDPFAATVLGTALGAGGAYGGWRLADYLFEKRHMKELDDDIAKAKKEYERHLLGSPSSLKLRIPKVAEFVEKAAALYDEGGTEKMKKEAAMWPYAATAALTALLMNSAYNAYQESAASSSAERRLKAFIDRPRRRVAPARAVLSQPRQSKREVATSATKLPEMKTLEDEEIFKDPTKKIASVASVLLGV